MSKHLKDSSVSIMESEIITEGLISEKKASRDEVKIIHINQSHFLNLPILLDRLKYDL